MKDTMIKQREGEREEGQRKGEGERGRGRRIKIASSRPIEKIEMQQFQKVVCMARNAT